MDRQVPGAMDATEIGCVDVCEAVYRGLAGYFSPRYRPVWYPDPGAISAVENASRVLVIDFNGFPRPAEVVGLLPSLRMATAGVVAYTFERRQYVLDKLRALGVDAVVDKGAALSEVEAAIRAVVYRGAPRRTTAQRLGPRARYPLSRRQLEVLRGRARGESFPSIGARLGISPRTAAEYFGVIQAKHADFLANHSAADLEYALGMRPGDLLDWGTAE